MPPAPPHQGTSPQQQRRGGVSAAAFLSIARKALGKPYVWGGTGPSGFDCSGLVQWALTRAGVKGVPRTSEQQWAWADHISQADLRPGDLVFEQWPGDGPSPGHVAIYTGNGRIEEAAQSGVPVHEVPWSPGQVSAAGGRIVGYGRVPGLNGTAAAIAAQTTGLLSIPSDVIGFFTSAGTALDWLLSPSHWVRIIAGVSGTGLTLSGIWQLSHAGGQAGGFTVIPRPAALPLGILMTGVGAVLLFVAFHNLPDTVDSFPMLLGWLKAEVQGNATGQAQPAPARDQVT